MAATNTNKDERKKAVIDALNQARSSELHAIHQYMNQHYTLDDMDYPKLASKLREIAIDEMRHAEDFAERIKDLDGEPTAEFSEKVVKRQDVREIFGFDAKLEDATMDMYNKFWELCRENGDMLTASIFERIIGEEQAHFDYFDDTDTHIKELGESFLARQTEGAAD